MLNATLVGGPALAAKLEKLGVELGNAMSVGIGRACLRVQTRAKLKLNKPKASAPGPGGVLSVRTGRLRRSITFRVEGSKEKPVGTVGTNLDYGAAWEFGFDRKVGAGARGGPRTLKGAARDRYMLKHPSGIKHYEARSFLRSALQEAGPEIQQEIRQAVGRVMAGGRV